MNAIINRINNQITNDFVAMDIRQALHHLGEITGEITTDDLLANLLAAGKYLFRSLHRQMKPLNAEFAI